MYVYHHSIHTVQSRIIYVVSFLIRIHLRAHAVCSISGKRFNTNLFVLVLVYPPPPAETKQYYSIFFALQNTL